MSTESMCGESGPDGIVGLGRDGPCGQPFQGRPTNKELADRIVHLNNALNETYWDREEFKGGVRNWMLSLSNKLEAQEKKLTALENKLAALEYGLNGMTESVETALETANLAMDISWPHGKKRDREEGEGEELVLEERQCLEDGPMFIEMYDCEIHVYG